VTDYNVKLVVLARSRCSSINGKDTAYGSFSKYVHISVTEVLGSTFSGKYRNKTTIFFPDEHIYNLLVRQKLTFDDRLLCIE
jgi:hypothetical protein